MRAQASLKSDKVRDLGGGVLCISSQSRVVDGKERVHIVDPVDGWVSAKCLEPADDPAPPAAEAPTPPAQPGAPPPPPPPPGAPPPPPPPPSAALSFEDRGRRSLANGDWDAAVSSLTDALDGVAAGDRGAAARAELLTARSAAKLGRATAAAALGAAPHAAALLAVDAYEDAARACGDAAGSCAAFRARGSANAARGDFVAAARDATSALLLADAGARGACEEALAAAEAAARDAGTNDDGGDAKDRGDACYRRRLYAEAAFVYTERLQAGGDVAKVLSNRAAAYAKLGKHRAALADADACVSRDGTWGRGHLRRATALAALGDAAAGVLALVAALKAAAAAKEGAVVDEAMGLLAGAMRDERSDVYAAVDRCSESSVLAARADLKADADDRFRRGETGAALGLYGAAVELRDDDERLRANRAACLLNLGLPDAALADAKRAIEIAPSWARGYGRAATALLALKRNAHAYWYHARAAFLDETAGEPRKGCAEVLGRLVNDGESPARSKRDAEGFERDSSLSSTRVFSVSDVHYDHDGAWVDGLSDFDYRRDVLLIAGNVGETLGAVRQCLTKLRSKFRRVFFAPGNRDLGIRPATETSNEPDEYPDSVAKFCAFLDLCDELDVDTGPAEVCCGLFVLPLFSWCAVAFDEDDPYPGVVKQDPTTRWPVNDSDVPSIFAKWNRRRLARPYDGTVISFSAFLPRRDLPFPKHEKEALKAIGDTAIDDQLRSVRPPPKVHVFGRTRIAHDAKHAGVRYVQHPLGFKHEREHHKPLLLVYDGSGIVCRKHTSY